MVAVTVNLLVAPALAQGRQHCEGLVSIILFGQNCEHRSDHSGPRYINTGADPRQAGTAAGDGDRTMEHGLNTSGAAAPVVKLSPPPGVRAGAGAPPPAWISMEDGLINLDHVRRITLNSADGKTFQVMAALDHGRGDVTLLTTGDRAQAQRLLQRLATNVRAKVMAR